MASRAGFRRRLETGALDMKSRIPLWKLAAAANAVVLMAAFVAWESGALKSHEEQVSLPGFEVEEIALKTITINEPRSRTWDSNTSASWMPGDATLSPTIPSGTQPGTIGLGLPEGPHVTSTITQDPKFLAGSKSGVMVKTRGVTNPPPASPPKLFVGSKSAPVFQPQPSSAPAESAPQMLPLDSVSGLTLTQLEAFINSRQREEEYQRLLMAGVLDGNGNLKKQLILPYIIIEPIKPPLVTGTSASWQPQEINLFNSTIPTPVLTVPIEYPPPVPPGTTIITNPKFLGGSKSIPIAPSPPVSKPKMLPGSKAVAPAFSGYPQSSEKQP
jgi:hypothetical protein